MRLLALSFVIALFASSCQADLGEDLNKRQLYTSLQDFQNKSQAASQTFTVNSSNFISVQGTKGTRFNFPPNAFVTLNNQPVTGSVSIEVKEILKPKEMILSNMPTVSDGKPLESGGQFFIRATQNSQELKLAPGKQVQVQAKADTPMVNMRVFTGQVTATGSVNWQQSTNQADVVRQDTTLGAGALVHSMFSSTVNWVNIDKFINEPLISYTVFPGNCPDLAQAITYVHLTGRNTVMGITKLADRFSADKIVAGPATVVAICVKDKKLYYAFAPVTLTNGGSVTLQFMETTEEDLKAKLATLH